MSAPAFAALAFAWDEMFSPEERSAISNLARHGGIEFTHFKWRDLTPADRARIIEGARSAIQLGQTCAQVTLVDIERIGRAHD